MIKMLIIGLFSINLFSIVFGQCLQENNFSNFRTRSYEVGEIVSIEDQLMEFDVCYGNYDEGVFKMADFNHNLNGGNYKVSMMRINATW